jgi:hypothetical protein
VTIVTSVDVPFASSKPVSPQSKMVLSVAEHRILVSPLH